MDQNFQILKQAVFELVAHEQDFRQLSLESETVIPSSVAPSSGGQQSGFCEKKTERKLSEICLLSQIEEQAKVNSVEVAIIAPSVVSKRIHEVIQSRNDWILLDEQLTICNHLLSTAKLLFHRGDFNSRSFTKLLTKQGTLPLELIWMLHKCSLVTLENYITSNYSRGQVIGKIAEGIAAICEGDKDTIDRRTAIVNDLTTCLLSLAYCAEHSESPAKGLKKISLALLDSITERLFTAPKGDINIFKCLHAMNTDLDLPTDAMKKFLTRQVGLLLCLNPEIKELKALSLQAKWTFAQIPQYVRDMYTQSLLPFTSSESLELLKRVLEQKEVNWQAVLSFTATLLVLYSDVASELTEFTNQLLQEACENFQMHGITTAFLLVRQACLEGQHVFPTYLQWFGLHMEQFQSTFSDNPCNPASNKKAFAFLVKFLTEVVPLEGTIYLKAHVLKPPLIPAKCRPLWSDYISLAKTRMQDLKEPMDQLGIYDDGENSSSDTAKTKASAEQDVERALTLFSKTGKVPSSVMEASIFRKPYFIGHFLPVLLRPRPLPDAPDDKMKLVAALHSADKIPSAKYNSYKTNCDKIANQLLDGVFSEDEDDNMDDMLLSPWQQFVNSLDSLKQALHQAGEKRSETISVYVSVISDKIHGFLDTTASEIPTNLVIGDSSGISKDTLKVAEELLNFICTNNNIILSGTISILQVSWLKSLMCILIQNSLLAQAFLLRIRQLCTKEGHSLQTAHVQTLASVVCTISKCTILGKLMADNNVPFILHLVRTIPLFSRQWMVFSFQFSAYFLQQYFISGSKSNSVVNEAVKIFQFLHHRLCQNSCPVDIGDHILQKLVDCVRHSQEYKTLQHNSQLSFDDWIKLELKIVPHHDFFTDEQRLEFYEYIVHHHFLQLPAASGGCEGSLRLVCTKVAIGVIMDDKRKSSEVCGSFHEDPHCCNTADNSASMMLLLQRLVQYLPYHHADSSLPWIHQLFNQITEYQDAKDHHRQKYFKLLVLLPPHLVFADSVHSSPDPTIAIQMIHEQWVDYMTDGAFLSFGACLHLIKGALAFPGHDVIPELLKDSAFIRESTMFFWRKLGAFSTGVDGSIPEALLAIQHLDNFARQLMDCPDTDVPDVIAENEKRLIAASMFADFMLEPKDKCEACLAVFKNDDDESSLTLSFVEFLLVDMAKCMMADKVHSSVGHSSAMLCSCLKINPHSLHHVEAMTHNALTAGTIRRMIPYALFKCLQVCKKSLLKELLTCPLCLGAILTTYNRCISVYEASVTVDDSNNRMDVDVNTGPVSLPRILEIGQFIQSLLQAAPQRCVKRITKNVVESLDPSVRFYVNSCQGH